MRQRIRCSSGRVVWMGMDMIFSLLVSTGGEGVKCCPLGSGDMLGLANVFSSGGTAA